MKAYGGMVVSLHTFGTSAAVAGELSAICPGRIKPGEAAAPQCLLGRTVASAEPQFLRLPAHRPVAVLTSHRNCGLAKIYESFGLH